MGVACPVFCIYTFLENIGQMAKRKNLRIVLIIFLIALLGGGYYVYGEYAYRFVGVTTSSTTIQVTEDGELEEWLAGELEQQGVIPSAQELISVAGSRGLAKVKAGNYKVSKGESYRTLLSKFAYGRETPVRVTFNNIRTLEQLAGVLSRQLRSDSLTFLDTFRAEAKAEGGANYIARFIPNTYEFYWSVSPEEFSEKMLVEFEKFWNDDRKAKAKKLGFTPQQIVNIAAIVDEETNLKSEMDEVAGVYINRLRIGMPLQADPTVKYAVGDFTIKRVLNKHLTNRSPYNTYVHGGLPPGPICSPSIAAIDATLSYSGHKYLYFCANADFSGSHAFATTLSGHNANARAYQRELNRRGIR